MKKEYLFDLLENEKVKINVTKNKNNMLKSSRNFLNFHIRKHGKCKISCEIEEDCLNLSVDLQNINKTILFDYFNSYYAKKEKPNPIKINRTKKNKAISNLKNDVFVRIIKMF